MPKSKNVDVLTKSVLEVLKQRKQTGLIPQVGEALRKLESANREKNKGIVYSSVLLGAPRLQRITKIVNNYLQRNVVLTNQVDKKMLGGFRVEVGDWILDASLKSDFEILRKTLLNK